MANLSFTDIRVSGMSACVPSTIQRNADLTDLIPASEIEKTISSIGIVERRRVAPGVCASDLCEAAACGLLEATRIDKRTIDVLIFMSQSPDYPVPATAPGLQHRLGLPQTCAAFDISLGCSGYLYALATAFIYAAQPNIRRVLLLDGETFTRLVSPRDKVNAPLYGDAGTATLIEKGGGLSSWFSLFSNGSGQDTIRIHSGGARHPVSADSLVPREAEEGNVRSDCQLHMDGMEVFNFTIKVVPQSILALLSFAGTSLEEVDYLVFHQANRFMTDFFARKIKCPKTKIPYSLTRFGNTSSASIPLTIVAELSGRLEGRKRVLMSGFGAGLSWAAALMEMADCVMPPLVEL